MSTQLTPRPQGFLDSFLDAASPAGATGQPSDILQGPKQLLTHPLDSIKMLAGAMNDTSNSELQQSKDAFGKGDYVRSALHGLGYAVPLVGPLVAKAGEQSQAHNFAGAAGTTIGTVAPILAGEMAKGPLAGEHPAVAEQALQEHVSTGGSTTNPRTGQSLAGSRQVAVGIAPEHAAISDRPFTPDQYSQFVATHRDVLSTHPNVAVGTHLDPATGLHHMELVGTTTSKTAAGNLGAHLGEDHAYNLATDEPLPTGASGDRQPSHLSVNERLAELNAQTPQKTPYSGTHFSDAKLDMIDGARRGSSGASAEATRLRLGSQTGMGEDAPGGFHTYKAGALPDGPMASKANAYQIRGRMAFASTEHPEFQNGYAQGVQKASLAGADAKTAHQLGLNAAERAVQDAGFDGYFSPKHPSTRFHFGSEPAVPAAPKTAPELDWAKAYGPQKTDFNGNVPAENQGFDWSPPKDYGQLAKQADRRSTSRPALMSPTDIEGAMKNRKPMHTPFDVTEGSMNTIKNDPMMPKYGTNGSGESSASLEAVNRVAAEKANGTRRVVVDSRSGNERPLFGVDAVDYQPRPHEVVIQRTPQGDIELARGHAAGRTK
jgi:hypothetical protein